MKTLIVYKSRTGFTKRYAEQIAQEAGVPLLDFQKAAPDTLRGYDRVVFGSRIHAGMIDGLKAVRALLPQCGIKSLVLFATGGTPNEARDVVKSMWRKNLTEQELASIPHFYMQSGINYEKMGLFDKAIMKTAALLMGRKKDKSNTEKGFEQAITRSYDISAKEYAQPLIDYLTQGEERL